MKLLTKEIIGKFPGIKETESLDPSEVQIIAKFFTPWAGWTWYATEMERIEDMNEDGSIREDFMFFGYVIGHFKELGYFVLSELEEIQGPFRLRIERDKHFSGTLEDVMTGKKQ